MTTFSLESQMAGPVRRYFARKTFRKAVQELPFYEYRIDLYAVSSSLRLTVAVELKLKKWERAIQQALVYQLCADLVYIALPVEAVDSRCLDSVHRYGLGLLLVNPVRCRELVEPMRSEVVREDYLMAYRSRLECGACA